MPLVPVSGVAQVRVPDIKMPFRLRLSNLHTLVSQFISLSGEVNVGAVLRPPVGSPFLTFYVRHVFVSPTYTIYLSFPPVGYATGGFPTWISVPAFHYIELLSQRYDRVPRYSVCDVEFTRDTIIIKFNKQELIRFTHNFYDHVTSGILLYGWPYYGTASILVFADIEPMVDESGLVSTVLPATIGIAVVSALIGLIAKLKF